MLDWDSKLDWEHSKLDWEHNKLDWERSKLDWECSKLDWERSKLSWEPNKLDWECSKLDWEHSKLDWEPSKLDWEPSKLDWAHSKSANCSICKLTLPVKLMTQNKQPFAPNVNSSGHSHVGSVLTNDRWILVQHMPALLMTPLIQTHCQWPHSLYQRHRQFFAWFLVHLTKRQHSIVMFLSLFKRPLLTNRTRNQVKNCCVSIFNIIPISSDASLLRFSFKVTCCEIFPFICPHEGAPHHPGFKANSLLISLGAGLTANSTNTHPVTAGYWVLQAWKQLCSSLQQTLQHI